MPRARAITRWRGRASIPTSSYRGRPDGWASWKASPRSKRSSATTRRSRKTRPRSTRCAWITSISSTPDSPPPAGSWTRSSCQKKRARRWPFSSRRRANSPAHTSEPSCCRVNHDTAAHPGVAPGVDGRIVTSTGAPKLLDVRDFSGEGVVRLTPVTPTGDGTVAVAGRALAGAGRIGRLTTATTWYAGVLAERPLGKVPGADLNGDGTNSDAFPVIVVKATDGWVAFIDTNLDGSFE